MQNCIVDQLTRENQLLKLLLVDLDRRMQMLQSNFVTFELAKPRRTALAQLGTISLKRQIGLANPAVIKQLAVAVANQKALRTQLQVYRCQNGQLKQHISLLEQQINSLTSLKEQQLNPQLSCSLSLEKRLDQKEAELAELSSRLAEKDFKIDKLLDQLVNLECSLQQGLGSSNILVQSELWPSRLSRSLSHCKILCEVVFGGE